MSTYLVDFSRADGELRRMVAGQIPFNQGYLDELIEVSGPDDVQISFVLACEECGQSVNWVECPVCVVLLGARSPECSLCEGAGGFFECPKCSGGQEVAA